MSSRATSGASVRLLRCRGSISAATLLSCSFTRRLGTRDFHAQRPERFLHPPHQLLEVRIVAGRQRQHAKSRRSPCCDSFPARPSTIVSTSRMRSGRLMTVLWQNRHCQGQPRMISIEIRSCTHSTNGTIGRVGSGMPSRSSITRRLDRRRARRRRVRCNAASRPSAPILAVRKTVARRRTATRAASSASSSSRSRGPPRRSGTRRRSAALLQLQPAVGRSAASWARRRR